MTTFDNETKIVSVVVPARNERERIASVIRSVLDQDCGDVEIEVVLVDDHSTDNTVELARGAGATLVVQTDHSRIGNPAHARNLGAKKSRGDPIIFLDADCVPTPGWLAALLSIHSEGVDIVGGALDLPAGLGFIARCDYYCGCYFTNSRRPYALVPHNPPNNLSVRRDVFFETSGFSEQAPLRYTNEERHWLAEARNNGRKMAFQPAAIVYHYNRPGLGNFLRRSYRWGYTSLEAKSNTGVARASWFFRHPWLVLAVAPVLPLVFSIHIVASWVRVGIREPILLAPLILLSRVTYVSGMVVGGLRWLSSIRSKRSRQRPEPRWQ